MRQLTISYAFVQWEFLGTMYNTVKYVRPLFRKPVAEKVSQVRLRKTRQRLNKTIFKHCGF